MPQSSEGYLWTPEGAVEGLTTDAVVPSSDDVQSEYDVVVIGAGFAGLVTARDLSAVGLRVLLVEGRDRIGGRTWTAKALGEEFEMGGTWVHWNQPHVYNELYRYGLHKHLKTSMGSYERKIVYWKPKGSGPGEIVSVNHLESGSEEDLIKKFIAVDGLDSRFLMPWPHDPHRCDQWQKYDGLSVRDRLDQLTEMPEQAKDIFEALTGTFNLAPATEGAYTDVLHWYGLCGHTLERLSELTVLYKIGKGGMTSLARAIYHDFRGDSLFQAKVVAISQETDGRTQVKLGSGRAIRSKAVVSTVPLNCLGDVSFSPELSSLRREAILKGHSNKGRKFHFRLAGIEEGWFALCANPPTGKQAEGQKNQASPYVYAISDHNGTKDTGPDGTYCAAFAYADQLTDRSDHAAIISEFQNNLRPNADVKAYLTHDWVSDPLAKGGWCFLGPNSASEYQIELQKPHGNVYFASADTADGWRGFVDGAIEQALRITQSILTLLHSDAPKPAVVA